MDVRLPDGTIVKNVPEGTTQRELAARLGGATTKPEAPSFMEGVQTGFNDPSVAVAQMTPRWFNRLTLSEKALANRQRSKEQQASDLAAHEARRAAAGETGVDWGRLAGNVVNPVTLMPAIGVGRAATTTARI